MWNLPVRIAILLHTIYLVEAARISGGSRISSSSGRISSLGSSRAGSSSSSGRYITSSSGRTYFSGTRYVPYTSRIVYRPLSIVSFSTYRPYYYYRSSYYYRTSNSDNQNSYGDEYKEQIIYANLASHCNQASFGIDQDERYLIFARADNKTAVTSAPIDPNYGCTITLTGPELTKFNLTFESSNECATWPIGCQLEVTEFAQTNMTLRNLLFYRGSNSQGLCSSSVFQSELDALTIRVTNCDPNGDTFFNFLLTAQNSTRSMTADFLTLFALISLCFYRAQ